MALRQMRLLMQPQVQWEPVADALGVLRSSLNGGPTLVGAQSVMLVPVSPDAIATGILETIKATRRAAALFSLPFGLRAMVRLSPPESAPGQPPHHGVETTLHEPGFGVLQSARQFRLQATGAPVASRQMPGTLMQLANFPPGGPLSSVLPQVMMTRLNQDFAESVPLHHADLSGYGLSSFSEWSQTVNDTGFIKAHFHVLNGRTAYEVIQFKSICWPSQARVVRTITLERHNSGVVKRTDSGWVAVDVRPLQPVGSVREGRRQRPAQHPADPDHRFGRRAIARAFEPARFPGHGAARAVRRRRRVRGFRGRRGRRARAGLRPGRLRAD